MQAVSIHPFYPSGRLVLANLQPSQGDSLIHVPAMSSASTESYSTRASRHANPVARKLFEIAESKRSNVTVSADLTTTKALLDLADRR